MPSSKQHGTSCLSDKELLAPRHQWLASEPSEMIAAACKGFYCTAWCASLWTALSILPPLGWYRGHRLRRKSKKVRSCTQFVPCVCLCVSDCFVFLVFNWHFLFQGIFPACYIHLKEATVEGSGWELFHSCGVFPPTSLLSHSGLMQKLKLFFLNRQHMLQMLLFLGAAQITQRKLCLWLRWKQKILEYCVHWMCVLLTSLPPDKKRPWYLLTCRWCRRSPPRCGNGPPYGGTYLS